MPTSLLYHAFGIRGYKYVRTHYENGSVLFTIRQNTKEMRCAVGHSILHERRPPRALESA